MPDYCNEENLKQTESVTMHEVNKLYPNDPGLDVASLKIIELSKKIRELNASLVSERNKSNNLYQIVRKLETESINSSNKNVLCSLCKQNSITTNENIENISDDAEQEKKKKNKLKKLESIVMELRQKIQTLNHDLLLAKKVIESETGELIPNLNSWLTNLKLKPDGTYGNWRGRQQQIIALKNRITKLQSQLTLKCSSRIEDVISKENIENETFSGATLLDIHSFQDNDDNMTSKTSKLDPIIEQNDHRTTNIIQLQNDKKQLEEEIDFTKKNLQKIKLHHHHLLQEQKELKQQILFLINKSKHDNELIESLIQHRNNLQNELNKINQMNQEKTNEIEKLNEEQLNFKQIKDVEIKKLEEIIMEKNHLIDNMNERLSTTNQIHLNISKHEIINETNNEIQSNLMNSSHYDLDYIKNYKIERDGLIKLIETMECRIEELINEKMKLEMKNAELTRKTLVKPNVKNQFLLINEKSIKSDDNHSNNNNNDNNNGNNDNNNNEQLFHNLINDNYIKNLIQKCSLSSYSMKIIIKCIKQYQTILIQYYNEIINLKNNIKLILDYHKDDFKLMMNIIDELKQQPPPPQQQQPPPPTPEQQPPPQQQ
ncbi:unnamed protein product [Schistosoma margrebowiei]|uniref:Uncharacterized protein n=1 Tax=Schistosoma margrebowiei TaxID=48269 RepID=A0A183MNU8_9TREM|nr:unnamed protein product [Schistosoma margrebowiei]